MNLCECCSSNIEDGKRREREADYKWTTKIGNVVLLCQSCLDAWTKNAMDDEELRPSKIEALTLDPDDIEAARRSGHLIYDVDLVNHPPHYSAHPSGVECITITETMGFCIGNAIKYLWRADEKGNALEDLKKAAWYVNREIARREKT